MSRRMNGGFRYRDARHDLDLPLPKLLGAHQIENAGLAIAALLNRGSATPTALRRGLQNVEWPARLQHITAGRLLEFLRPQDELWLDGGHNDSAGAALARQAEAWQKENPTQSLHLICGMLASKQPCEFLAPLAPFAASLTTLAFANETAVFSADDLAARARESGCRNVEPAPALEAALARCAKKSAAPVRILICGSLYLAGEVLRLNAAEAPWLKRQAG